MSALRIAIVQGGRIVEERLLRRPARVTFGPSARDTFVVPSARSRALFDAAPSGGWRLRGEEGAHAPLDERARGRVALDDFTVLYQVVVAPTGAPRPRLPPSLRGSLARDLDWAMIGLVAASLVGHAALVWYVRGIDLPRAPEIVELPRRDVHAVLMPRREPPAPPATPPITTIGEPGGGPRGPKSSTGPRPPIDLAAEIRKTGLVAILGARDEGATMVDLLRRGSPPGDDRVFEEVSGVGIATREPGLRSLRGAAPSQAKGIAGLRLGDPGEVATGERGGEAIAVLHGTVRTGPPLEPIGGGDPQIVADEVRRRKGALVACYERALLKEPTLAGRVVLRLAIDPAGRVTAATLEEDALGNPPFAACLLAAARGWRLPPPGADGIEVSFPFIFQPSQPPR
jgi:TonB family protein